MMIVAITAAVLLLWVIWQDGRFVGTSLAFACLLHSVRLGRWAGDRTLRDRLVLILHIGYAFVPFGFLLAALGAVDRIPASAGIHAWMAGAAGVMTLAVMTRATLGHTGQVLKASLPTQVIYAAGIVAALARICAVIDASRSDMLLNLAAGGWAIAFLGFAGYFGPSLIGPTRRT
jgi:uncharacterized protein involved in response to NO